MNRTLFIHVNLVVNKNMKIQKLEQRLGKEIKLQ
jgi:hypothetical protein